MGLFKKKEQKEEKENGIPALPELPRLPELPNFSGGEDSSSLTLPQLQRFPRDLTGSRLPSYNLRAAVAGEKEEEIDADDFVAENEMQTMQKSPIKEERDFYSKPEKIKPRASEPLFIRIDKFEAGSQAFEEIKKQVLAVEKLFNDLKKVKENEENEMRAFENQIRQIKDKLENIDRNIFSKIE